MIAADEMDSEELHVAINWIAEVRQRLGRPVATGCFERAHIGDNAMDHVDCWPEARGL